VLVDGKVEQLGVRCHDPELHARRIDKTPEIESWFRDYFLAHSIAWTGRVGAGEAWWMRARRLVDALDELSRKGVTIYDVSRQARESAGGAS